MDPKLSQAEIKRLLTIAMAQPKTDTGRLLLSELKAGASELGVPAEKLEEAYQQLRIEQQRAVIMRNRMMAISAPVLVVGALVVGGTWMATRPAPPPVAAVLEPFTGAAHVTVTTRVDNDQPIDALTRVSVTSKREFFVFVSLTGLTRTHRAHTDLVDASGAIVETDTVQMTSTAEPYSVWFRFHVPFTRKPGTYQARSYLDGQLVATTPIDIVIGNTSMSTALGVKDAAPLTPRTRFVVGVDGRVLAFLHFDELLGSGSNVEFRWTAPDGTVARTHIMTMREAKGPYAAWDVLDFEGSPPLGSWKVAAFFEGTPINETKFDVSAGGKP
jgi:hypothetical protein